MKKSFIYSQHSIFTLLHVLVFIFTTRRSHDSADFRVVILSVRLSVCHTRALWLIQRNYRRYFYTTWKSNPSSFLMPKISAKFQWGHPRWGRQIEGGRLKRRFSTNIWLYLTNGAKSGHSYYGTLIGTRMCSIDWCYFQWPWVTLTTQNHPIFDILYRLSYLRSEWR